MLAAGPDHVDDRVPGADRLAEVDGALAAVDAPPASYLVGMGLAEGAGVTIDDLRSTLVAVAPIIGSARVTAAAGNILRAAGIAVAIADGE